MFILSPKRTETLKPKLRGSQNKDIFSRRSYPACLGVPNRDLTPRVSVLYSVRCTGIPRAPPGPPTRGSCPPLRQELGRKFSSQFFPFSSFIVQSGGGGGILKWPLGIGRLWDSCRQRACSRERGAWAPKDTWTPELAQDPPG